MEDRADILDFFEDAPCGFISVSTDDQIVRVNRTLTGWLGITADDLLGSPLNRILSKGAQMAFETHIRPLLRMQGYVYELSLDLLDQAGERVPFIANITERRGDDGHHISTRFALIKARDRKLYEESLLNAREAAESSAQSERETSLLREQFIAVLGHDLRNPLTAIISGINIIKRRKEFSESETAILDGMSKSAWRAENLINDVLDFARGRLGDGLVLKRSLDNDLIGAITQVIDESRVIAPDCNIQANVTIDRPVYCDTERICQLLANLLSNAIAHGDPSRGIIIEATSNDDDCTLSVENFGTPIPAELKDNLFRPFFRGNARENKKGLGLGLFIVSEIAEAHSGKIDVESNSYSTVFRLKFPSAADAEPQI